MGRFRDLMTEWSARRTGRQGLRTEASRASRHIVGRIGLGTTAAWDQMERSQKAYLESFDRRLPPSLHISERDRLRANTPIPTVERCIEDWRPRSRRDASVAERSARLADALNEFEQLHVKPSGANAERRTASQP